MNVRAGRRDEMIYLRDYIGGSSVRECYRHPLFDDKCIKIVKNKKDLPGLLREVRVSKLVAPYLKDYIVEYDDELVETDKGPGLVCGLVRNDENAILGRFCGGLSRIIFFSMISTREILS